jgi:hypothetical protein
LVACAWVLLGIVKSLADSSPVYWSMCASVRLLTGVVHPVSATAEIIW